MACKVSVLPDYNCTLFARLCAILSIMQKCLLLLFSVRRTSGRPRARPMAPAEPLTWAHRIEESHEIGGAIKLAEPCTSGLRLEAKAECEVDAPRGPRGREVRKRWRGPHCSGAHGLTQTRHRLHVGLIIAQSLFARLKGHEDRERHLSQEDGAGQEVWPARWALERSGRVL